MTSDSLKCRNKRLSNDEKSSLKDIREEKVFNKLFLTNKK
jgi:hypothetical protein